MARYTRSGSVISVPQINSELEKIEEAFKDVVTRSGQAPNNLQETLDMDNNKITNVLTDLDDPNSLVSRKDLYVKAEVEALDAATLSSAQASAASGDAATLQDSKTFAQDLISATENSILRILNLRLESNPQFDPNNFQDYGLVTGDVNNSNDYGSI